MEPSTTIRRLFTGNQIFVPSYQRAYSWETQVDGAAIATHTDVFYNDLMRHVSGKPDSPYYFGHFLFRNLGKDSYEVIDGQQRLTTIVIFLSAIFKTIRAERDLETREKEIFEDIIVRNNTCRFATIDYDNQLFRDYVIYQTRTNRGYLETVSARRIVDAFDFFGKKLSGENLETMNSLLDCVTSATSTTHLVSVSRKPSRCSCSRTTEGKSLPIWRSSKRRSCI